MKKNNFFLSQMGDFLKHGVVNVLGMALISFLSFVFNFLVVKVLSVANYGEYTSVTAYLALFSAPLTILSLIVTKKVSGVEKKARFKTALGVHHKFLALLQKNWWLILIIPLWWWLLATGANLLTAWSAPTILILLFLSLFTVYYTAIFTGWQRFGVIVGIGLAGVAVKLVGGATILAWQSSLLIVLVILVLAGVAQVIINWAYFRRQTKLARVNERVEAKGKAKSKAEALHIFEYFKKQSFLVPLIGVITTTALINADMMVVKLVASPEFAGAYGLFSLFAKIMLYASQPLINVAFTFFSQPGDGQLKRIIFWVSGGLLVLFTVLMAVIYGIWDEQLILIVGKADYLVLAGYLGLAAIFGGLYSIALLLAQFLIAKNRRLVYLGLLAPVVQVALIYFFHQSLEQVMQINIWVSGGLILLYGGGLLWQRWGRTGGLGLDKRGQIGKTKVKAENVATNI